MDTERQAPLITLLGELRDALGVELHRRLRELGFAEVRPAHSCVFANIDEGGSRLTDLADRSGLTKQSVGEAVGDLERLGFVERVSDPVDGRAKIIRLTEHGIEALDAAREILADIEGRFADEVGAERVSELRELLVRLSGVVGQPADATHEAA